MEELTDNHLFGILLSVVVYYGGLVLRNRFKIRFINPLLLGIIFIIVFLTTTKIPYENYMKGGSIIHAFLGPVTVVLALPLYRQRKLLMKYKYSIIAGIVTGVVSSIISVILLCHVFNLNDILERSLVGHSVTTPIGISISTTLGAVPGIAVIAIMITGLLGASVAPLVFRVFKVTHPVARGLGLGTSSHALGTTRAMEMGQTEGAVSSLAIGVAALTTVILVAILQLTGWY